MVAGAFVESVPFVLLPLFVNISSLSGRHRGLWTETPLVFVPLEAGGYKMTGDQNGLLVGMGRRECSADETTKTTSTSTSATATTTTTTSTTTMTATITTTATAKKNCYSTRSSAVTRISLLRRRLADSWTPFCTRRVSKAVHKGRSRLRGCIEVY